MDKIKLLRIHFLPNNLEPGILYVSEDFAVAGHICPCGCGSKIITPLTPNEWKFTEVKGKPSLYPSIGNWQLPCRSHYWIRKGIIEWSYQWTDEEIMSGRNAEEERQKYYYENLNKKSKKKSIVARILNWFY